MSIIINKVRVNNFRSLKNVELELDYLTLLVGANNSGKTSFLKALSIAIGLEHRFLSKDDLFIDKGGVVTSDPISIDVYISPAEKNFDEPWALEFGGDIQSDSNGNDFFAFRTSVNFKTLNEGPLLERFNIKDWDSGKVSPTDKLKARIDKIPLYFMDANRDLLEEIKNPASYFSKLSKQIKYEEKTLKEIEKSLNDLNEDVVSKSDVLTHIKKQLEELNHTVNNRGKGVEITPLPKKLRDIHKGLKIHFQDGESETFSLEYHGMGTRSWASLLALKAFVNWESELSKNNKEAYFPILGLEEPEAHLHPNAQRHVYSQLKSIDGQKIISTHSPHILAQASLQETRLFNKIADATEVYKVDMDKISSEEERRIKNEIIYSKGELLFSKLVILVEGPTEELFIPPLAQGYFESFLYERGILVVSCNGNAYKMFLILLNSLKIPWVIFSDYDQPNVKKGVDNALNSISLDPRGTYPNCFKLNSSIEKYLIDNGFQAQLKEGINEVFKKELKDQDERAFSAKKNEIDGLSDSKLIELLQSDKTKFVEYYATSISKLAKAKYPELIIKLFEYLKSFM